MQKLWRFILMILIWKYISNFTTFEVVLGLMKGLGKGIKEFKDAKNDTSKELEEKDEN